MAFGTLAVVIIIIILRERQTRSPKAIEHTQVRLQPEPGALCTGLQPCQLASAPMKPSRSIPPSYTDAEGPSLANHPKLQDGFRQRQCGCLRGGRTSNVPEK